MEECMPIKKYIEIEWKEIRLKPFKDWGTTKFYLNASTNAPTSFVPQNIMERLISDVHQRQLEDKSWVLTPKQSSDQILFSGYADNLLQVALTVMESDQDAFINSFSTSSEKLAEVFKTASSGIAAKLFPFFGISSLIFSGIAALFKDSDDFLGSYIYQLRGDTIISIGRPVVGKFFKGDQCTGEVDLGIYIKPEGAEGISFYRDVEIFPFSANEIAVYYSGELSNSKQVFTLWTLNTWKSHRLSKMKKWDRFWTTLLEIPEDTKEITHLEVAFTDDEQHWDNHDGNNWVFQNFRWV